MRPLSLFTNEMIPLTIIRLYPDDDYVDDPYNDMTFLRKCVPVFAYPWDVTILTNIL